MSTNEHTDGPWRVKIEKTTLAMNGVGQYGVYGPKGVVCFCDESTIAETAANAHLISAAPEMLSLLERALRDVCEYRRFYPDQGDVNPPPFILEMQNVIAKARGQK